MDNDCCKIDFLKYLKNIECDSGNIANSLCRVDTVFMDKDGICYKNEYWGKGQGYLGKGKFKDGRLEIKINNGKNV